MSTARIRSSDRGRIRAIGRQHSGNAIILFERPRRHWEDISLSGVTIITMLEVEENMGEKSLNMGMREGLYQEDEQLGDLGRG